MAQRKMTDQKIESLLLVSKNHKLTAHDLNVLKTNCHNFKGVFGRSKLVVSSFTLMSFHCGYFSAGRPKQSTSHDLQ